MSKVDAQRAMREAKYARTQASGPTRREAAALKGGAAAPETVAAPETAAAPAAPSAKPTRAAKAVPAGGDRCGHKSMNGRECTREAGHPEKSHRYG
jgi:hypothetical protein